MGQAQRARANSGQDTHDQRRDAEAAGKGPAYGSQHNTDGLAAVFPLAFQAAFPGSESVGLFHSHRVPRLFQSVGNAAQHRRADLAAHLKRVVDHIAEVIVIFVIVFVVWHGLSNLFIGPVPNFSSVRRRSARRPRRRS